MPIRSIDNDIHAIRLAVEGGGVTGGGGTGGTGDASASNQILQLTELQEINDKTPVLVNGKIPVDVASLNVTVANAQLEIANTSGNPIPIDDAGGSLTIDGTVSVNPLPAGNNSIGGVTQSGNWTVSVAQNLLTNTELRASPVPVSGTFFPVTQPISATALPLPSGAATANNQSTANTHLNSLHNKMPSGMTTSSGRLRVVTELEQGITNAELRASPVPITGTVTATIGTGSGIATETTLVTLSNKIPTLTLNSGRLIVDNSGVTQPITGTVSTEINRSEFGSLISVSSSITSTTLLQSNINRTGVTIYNDSTANLYLKLAGGTVSINLFTVKIKPDGYYEVPFNYSGIILGIWDAVNGFARITEFSNVPSIP